jgi:hypothetical protein
VSCFQGHPVSLVFSLILAATSTGHLCAYAFAPLLLPATTAANGVLETRLVAPFWIALGLMAFAFVIMLAFDCVDSKNKPTDADQSNATAAPTAADSAATTTVDVSPNSNGIVFGVPESQRQRSSAWQRFRAMLGHCVADSFLLHSLVFAMIVIYAFQHPFWSFAPDYYQSRLGYSMVDSGRLVAVSYLVLIIASPLVNWCLERTGHLPTAMLLGALLLAFAAVAIGFNRQFHLAPSSSRLTALMIGSITLASFASVVFHSANSAVFLAIARFEHIGELYALINSLSCAATTAVNISVGYLR